MVVVFAALVLGGSLTFLALWPFGIFVALLGAPFGASIAAALVAIWLAIDQKYR
jgi:hypothetical protein